MNTFSRRKFRRAASVAFLVAGIAPASAVSLAATAAVPTMTASQRIADAALPGRAKSGTGLAGTFNPAALSAAAVSITLPDGRELRAERQRVAQDGAAGRKSWVGTFGDQPGSMLVLTTYRGTTTGFATYGVETWEMLPDKAGRHLLYRVDDARLPTAEPVLLADAGVAAITSADYGTGTATTSAAGYVHDLLVVYTPAAKSSYGQATLESMIQGAVAAANQAYQNSGIAITLNLVGLQEIAYTEGGGMQASLSDLQGTADGRMDTVHVLRNEAGADIVTLVSMDNDACGIAWAMRTESASFESSAFNVVHPACLSQHSLAHEVGHNQGNMHDRASTTSTGAFPYSYGFRRCTTDGTGFRTVMAYSCSGANRVAWFSSPSAYYNGYATGIAYETDPASSADNARSMNNTADTVAAFRSAGGATAGSVPVAPSSLAASATSAIAATVGWADNSADETGFKLERSANGVDFVEVATLGAGTATYVDSGLAPASAYYYRVRAYNGNGNSAYSNTGAAAMPDAAPAAPLGVTAADNADGSATVAWVDGSTNETGFEIRREKWDAKRKAWTALTTVGSASSGVASIVDVCGTGTFRYTVRAVNSGGGSQYAGPASVSVTDATVRTKGRR